MPFICINCSFETDSRATPEEEATGLCIDCRPRPDPRPSELAGDGPES